MSTAYYCQFESDLEKHELRRQTFEDKVLGSKQCISRLYLYLLWYKKKREHLILSIVRVDFCVCCSDLKERTSDFKHSKSKCLRLLYPTAGERGGETDIHYIQNIEAKSNLKDLLIMFTLMCTCDVCKRSESICINPRL